jgi:CRISPR-associated protein (Cas_Csd1)
MIRASVETSDGREEPEGPHDGVTSAEPRPFSHDSHFSISPHSAHGYRLHVIHEIIVIGGNGQIVAVEHPQFPVGDRRRKSAMPVPVVTMPKRHDPLRFLWGPGRSVLGLSGARPGTLDDTRAAKDHLKYKALHHRVLEGVGDIALQAFLRFLERETASVVSELPMTAERPRCKLAFRFQYDEHYLHERHAAQLAWKRFLTGRPLGADPTPPLATERG